MVIVLFVLHGIKEFLITKGYTTHDGCIQILYFRLAKWDKCS